MKQQVNTRLDSASAMVTMGLSPLLLIDGEVLPAPRKQQDASMDYWSLAGAKYANTDLAFTAQQRPQQSAD